MIMELSIKQIKQIYEAGIRRGNDEQLAFDWGSRPCGKAYDELEDTLHDILNEGINWGEEGYKDFTAIKELVNAS